MMVMGIPSSMRGGLYCVVSSVVAKIPIAMGEDEIQAKLHLG